jgi:hypothetical protein
MTKSKGRIPEAMNRRLQEMLASITERLADAEILVEINRIGLEVLLANRDQAVRAKALGLVTNYEQVTQGDVWATSPETWLSD